MKEYIEQLKAMPLFTGLDSAALEEVRQAAQVVERKKSGFFFRQGELAKKTFALISGRVKITQINDQGQQVFIRVISPGEIFALVATKGDTRYPVSAQAERSGVALAWEARDLLTLMNKHPKIAINGLQILSSRVQELQDRFRELATERVEQRLARILLRLAGKMGSKQASGILLDLLLSRQDLAEMTGTTLFTVSRILNQWQTLGFLEIGRQRVLIRNPHRLLLISETPVETSDK